MDLIRKAVWHVETHLLEPVTLEEIARHCAVGPSHLTRVFSSVTGLSLMRYARARRLSEAARRLSAGEPDILGLALDIGYGSHEAFTRAFRAHFGATPEQARDGAHPANLMLTEAISMQDIPVIELDEPRLETTGPIRLAGLVKLFAPDQIGAIASLWQQFNARSPALGGVVGNAAYGVSLSFSEERGCEYMCALEVGRAPDLPEGFEVRALPAATYAVFRQPGHITLIRPTIHAAWTWLEASAHDSDGGALIEKYGRDFDPVTGNGGFEIWLPLAAR